MPLSTDFEETEEEIELNLIKCDPSLNNDGFIGSPRPTMISTNMNKINKFPDLFIGNDLFEFITMETNRYYRQNYGRNKSHKKMRKVEVDEIYIKAIIDSDRHTTTHKFAEELNVSHTCIQKKLKQLGYVKKLDLWVPHQLKEIHSMQLISICDSLLKRNEIDPFLKRQITGNDKWIVYNNLNRRRSWFGGIIKKFCTLNFYQETKINLNVYVQQLDKLSEAVQEKRPELENRKDIVLQHDNAKPHTSLVIRQKLLELGWDVMSHSSYSPDLTPSDYYLFRSTQNSLNDLNGLSIIVRTVNSIEDTVDLMTMNNSGQSEYESHSENSPASGRSDSVTIAANRTRTNRLNSKLNPTIYPRKMTNPAR
ncbi:hypothetical protein HZH68_016157 [Vespula germanica]|uniref:Histone-lysine N-methyltransferase SETMAR n=1 Tax=Vespula germanica TaxID=30212 RepID=A0A834J633_VESGE|nr:hypothetical protein HZH68_016157 [Vespula germanica]